MICILTFCNRATHHKHPSETCQAGPMLGCLPAPRKPLLSADLCLRAAKRRYGHRLLCFGPELVQTQKANIQAASFALSIPMALQRRCSKQPLGAELASWARLMSLSLQVIITGVSFTAAFKVLWQHHRVSSHGTGQSSVCAYGYGTSLPPAFDATVLMADQLQVVQPATLLPMLSSLLCITPNLTHI